MKLFNFVDFFYVIEHNNEYFEFEIEDDFLDNISEDLDIDNFDILKMSEVSEGNFDILIKTPKGDEKVYKYTLSSERISYILSITE
ncbi:MAG: hypothetical protein ACRDA2_00010 [Cetobacterium sp.]|uniref:hypothetical protein n=1 Tax=Cetobacterium TaxID=180162 RepID=UPI001F06B627|nr:hypothetical protein [Cetobacterium somerae]MCX3068605.1 hypothetical protein [Cetobacterium somerae]UPO98326.1 hypothetical protein MKD34_11840 [Cetobacterium somerae]